MVASTVLLSGRSDDDTGCDRQLLSRFQRSGRSSAWEPSENVTSVPEEQKQETGKMEESIETEAVEGSILGEETRGLTNVLEWSGL
jgi:hypothetical protein